MKPNLGYYVQKINDIVKDTEAIGEEMHPCYEEIRQAIDKEETAAITDERREEICKIFQEGTTQYEAMLETVRSLRPPARVMGIHKKFERAYVDYVAGCQEMIGSVTNGIDVTAFDAAEQKQDQATEEISFAIQRMTSMLLKR
ncbi:hypothetical protein IV487_03895 [Enterococcus saccharolyticus]|uniref:Uncharacterized protein n=1 Tax=Candidatus Enterococcus willemsii TaxID=1857215 RepID=A0ABQ6YY92_9ENTE|nr:MULTISPECIES: hypothetical protein [Enterococcus]KAF1303040.1 hypothetical protein BAU17_07880 [Enterococcus sp. CU12B]MCD5001612.1 hypothetical protein [Enterococcus saccharolyticus]